MSELAEWLTRAWFAQDWDEPSLAMPDVAAAFLALPIQDRARMAKVPLGQFLGPVHEIDLSEFHDAEDDE